jgi:hypothetical protein
LFGGITAEEIIAMHPVAGNDEVSSTGDDGIADNSINLIPGLYKIELETTDGDAFSGVLVGTSERLLKTATGEVVEVRIPLV